MDSGLSQLDQSGQVVVGDGGEPQLARSDHQAVRWPQIRIVDHVPAQLMRSMINGVVFG